VGPHCGRRRQATATTSRKSTARSRPGSRLAQNRRAMEVPVCRPMMSRTTLGGMTTPSVEPAATDPVASTGLYLYLRIWGRATVLMVAAVAVFEPQMAAKPAQARTVAMAKPPRMWPIQA
jgi:hypothetical protein